MKEQNEAQKINSLTKKIDILLKQNIELQQQIDFMSKNEIQNKYLSDKEKSNLTELEQKYKPKMKEKEKEKEKEREKERNEKALIREKEIEDSPSKTPHKSKFKITYSEIQTIKMAEYDQLYHFLDDTCDQSNYDIVFNDKYHSSKNVKMIKQEISQDRKIIRLYENGKKELIFPSGVRKEIFPDSYQIVFFTNNDIKQVLNYNFQ